MEPGRTTITFMPKLEFRRFTNFSMPEPEPEEGKHCRKYDGCKSSKSYYCEECKINTCLNCYGKICAKCMLDKVKCMWCRSAYVDKHRVAMCQGCYEELPICEKCWKDCFAPKEVKDAKSYMCAICR
jgi:hypothetical protein